MGWKKCVQLIVKGNATMYVFMFFLQICKIHPSIHFYSYRLEQGCLLIFPHYLFICIVIIFFLNISEISKSNVFNEKKSLNIWNYANPWQPNGKYAGVDFSDTSCITKWVGLNFFFANLEWYAGETLYLNNIPNLSELILCVVGWGGTQNSFLHLMLVFCSPGHMRVNMWLVIDWWQV